VEQEVRRHFPNTFETVIPRSVRLAEAPSHGTPIQQYDASSSGSRAYEALADELLAALGDRAQARSAPGTITTPTPQPTNVASTPPPPPAPVAPVSDPEGQY